MNHHCGSISALHGVLYLEINTIELRMYNVKKVYIHSWRCLVDIACRLVVVNLVPKK
jgi:hypothetical protein